MSEPSAYADPVLLAVRRTAEYLKRPPDDDKDPVHRHRVATKRIRSYLRLLKPSLPKEDYQTLNRKLRDASRNLSASRDTAVVDHTIRDLMRKKIHSGVIRALQHPECQPPDQTLDASRKEIEKCVRVLLQLSGKVAAVPAWHEGIIETYRRARRGWQRCQRTDLSDPFHAWRKDVKYLHLQLEALGAEAVPAALRYRNKLIRLEQLLGRHHDCDLVLDRCLHNSAKGSKKLTRLAKDRQKKLQQRSLKMGDDAFDRTPRQFSQKFLPRLV